MIFALTEYVKKYHFAARAVKGAYTTIGQYIEVSLSPPSIAKSFFISERQRKERRSADGALTGKHQTLRSADVG